MKTLQVISIFLIVLTSCNRNTIPDLKIEYTANWKIGDKIKYKVTKTKEDIKFGYNQGKYETTQVGVLEITGETDEEYELEWKIIKNIYPEGVEMDTFYTRIYEDMMKSFKIKYTTDKNGEFKELINWEDILNFQFETMDNISDIIEEEEGMKFEEIKTMMSQMFSSKEQVEAIFIEEIKLLHSFYGNFFQTKKANPMTKSVPNIFGGDKILVNSLITIENVDTNGNILIGKDKFSLDENTKNDMLSKYLKSLEEKFGKGNTDDNFINDLQVEITDNTDFSLNYKEGIANLISYKRDALVKSETQDLERVKEIIIERVE